MSRDTKKSVRIALLGCGTVGGGVLKLLEDNREAFAARVGAPLEVAHVLVKDPRKTRVPECDPKLITTNPEMVFRDETVDLVVEVIGGEEPAREFLTRALAARQSVVTANKLLIAKHGPELIQHAIRQSVDLAFEASVGGGIPIIRTLRDALASDSVVTVHGILNGTCNFVLTEMRDKGSSFDDAVKRAQELGYAEADPTMDVDGHDAAQKLVVTSMLAFGAAVPESQVPVEGIRGIDQVDFRFADRFGFTIKHLAIGRDHGDRVSLRAHPALVHKSSVLANIDGVLNGVYVMGRALGPCLLVGAGAGDMPTAVSVVADTVDVARSRLEGQPGLTTKAIHVAERPLSKMSDLEARYYLRFDVSDDSGVLGVIASELGSHGVSIEQMVQEGREEDDARGVPVLIITHVTREAGLQQALEAVAAQPFMKRPPRLIRIEEV